MNAVLTESECNLIIQALLRSAKECDREALKFFGPEHAILEDEAKQSRALAERLQRQQMGK